MERIDVVHAQAVQDLQGEDALQVTQGFDRAAGVLGPEFVDVAALLFVVIYDQVDQFSLEVFTASGVNVLRNEFIGHMYPCLHDREEFFQLFLLRDHVTGDALVHYFAHLVADHLQDALVHIGAFQHGAAISVDDFALPGDDIVIVDDVFADVEVIAFHLGLGLFDEARDHSALERHVFFHAYHLHDLGDAIGSEAAHQFIVQSQEETGLTGVALAARAAAQLVVDAAGLVALGSDDVQATQGDDALVVLFALTDFLLEEFVPLLLGHTLDVLPDRLFFFCTLVFGRLWNVADVVYTLGMPAQDGIEVAGGIAPQHDIGTTAGHVVRNGDCTAAPRLGDNLRLTLVVFRVEHVMWHALFIEEIGKVFRGLNGGSTNQDRYACFVLDFDLFNYGVEFRAGCAVDQVGQIVANHGHVGWNADDIQLIDFIEFLRLGEGGTGHASEFFVQAEEVLEGDRCERVVFPLDLDAFLGFDGLVETFAVAAARHQAPGQLIDNHDLTIFDDIVFVALEDCLGLDGVLHVARQVEIVFIIDVLDASQALKLLDAVLGQDDGACFLLDGVVGFGSQTGGPARELDILIGGFLTLARDDEGGARLVDEYVIDLVHDGVGKCALHRLVERSDHVVAQVVKAELVVRAIGNISLVSGTAFGRLRLDGIDNDADGQAEESVDLRGPRSITKNNILHAGDDLHAYPNQRNHVHGQRCGHPVTVTGLV